MPAYNNLVRSVYFHLSHLSVTTALAFIKMCLSDGVCLFECNLCVCFRADGTQADSRKDIRWFAYRRKLEVIQGDRENWRTNNGNTIIGAVPIHF